MVNFGTISRCFYFLCCRLSLGSFICGLVCSSKIHCHASNGFLMKYGFYVWHWFYWISVFTTEFLGNTLLTFTLLQKYVITVCSTFTKREHFVLHCFTVAKSELEWLRRKLWERLMLKWASSLPSINLPLANSSMPSKSAQCHHLEDSFPNFSCEYNTSLAQKSLQMSQ